MSDDLLRRAARGLSRTPDPATLTATAHLASIPPEVEVLATVIGATGDLHIHVQGSAEPPRPWSQTSARLWRVPALPGPTGPARRHPLLLPVGRTSTGEVLIDVNTAGSWGVHLPDSRPSLAWALTQLCAHHIPVVAVGDFLEVVALSHNHLRYVPTVQILIDELRTPTPRRQLPVVVVPARLPAGHRQRLKALVTAGRCRVIGPRLGEWELSADSVVRPVGWRVRPYELSTPDLGQLNGAQLGG